MGSGGEEGSCELASPFVVVAGACGAGGGSEGTLAFSCERESSELLCGTRSDGNGGSICESCTLTGIHPPGAWVIFASSSPRKRGIDGPVRSISRMPTDLPARESERASWLVIEDLPTPPLPERTCVMSMMSEMADDNRIQRGNLPVRCVLLCPGT